MKQFNHSLATSVIEELQRISTSVLETGGNGGKSSGKRWLFVRVSQGYCSYEFKNQTCSVIQ